MTTTPTDPSNLRSIWTQFKSAREKLLGREPILGLPAHPKKALVFLWLERDAKPGFAIRQALSQLGMDWGLQVFVTDETKAQARDLFAGWSGVQLSHVDLNMPKDFSRDILLRSEDFWTQVTGEHVLLVDEDSVVLRPLDNQFLDFDYVAPLWSRAKTVSPWCRFGPGELSLRRKDAMLSICRSCNTNPWLFPNEGVFFSVMLRLEKNRYKLPPDALAAAFGVETVFTADPFAIRHTFTQIAPDQLRAFLT